MKSLQFAIGAAAALLFSAAVSAVTLVYPNFSSTAGLQLNNAATTAPVFGQQGLRLTSGLGSAGSAFSTTAITLGSNASFSTVFNFAITNSVGASDSDGVGADGLVFVVQTVANNVGGAGGGIGYQGIGNSLGVEFDTWNNGGPGDPDGNHVGIDTGGSVSSLQTASVATRLNNGSPWWGWVDYDGSTNTLEVRLAQSAVRPAAPLLTRSIDLLAALGGSTTAFVGFTSGTGAAGGDHFILNWEFRDSFSPVPGGAGAQPSAAAEIPLLSPLGLLVTMLLVGGAAWRSLGAGRRR